MLTASWPHGAVWPFPELQGRRPHAIARGEPCTTVEISYDVATDLVPVFAIADGAIAFASDNSLILDHGRGWATYYAGLRHVFATPTRRHRGRAERVKAGDIVGYASALQFAIWRLDEASHYQAIDPRPILERCLLLPLREEVTSWTA